MRLKLPKTRWDNEVEHLLAEMADMKVGSENYKYAVEDLKALGEAREKHRFFKGDTIVNSIVYILGIVIVINHERLHIITTRAFSLVRLIR